MTYTATYAIEMTYTAIYAIEMTKVGTRRLREEHAEFFVKRLHRYCEAKSLSDLKTILLDSLLMSSSTVCHKAIKGQFLQTNAKKISAWNKKPIKG